MTNKDVRIVMVKEYYDDNDNSGEPESYIEFIPYDEVEIGDNFIDIENMKRVLVKGDFGDVIVKTFTNVEDPEGKAIKYL